ncbi:MAG: hypothetical protein KC550_08020, partial [Nanoarchaeota archaeon]|nr:hypothetical protein [Nanoarchaeota archaeon]
MYSHHYTVTYYVRSVLDSSAPSFKSHSLHLSLQTKKNDLESFYDYLDSDSKTEIEFGKSIDSFDKEIVFSKVPRKKYEIKTPVGYFRLDWLIVFDKDKVQFAYFVVEIKGSNSKMQLRKVEDIKIECPRKHFKAISSEEIQFDVVN